MVRLLCQLTNFMEACDPMTCSLFADVISNYNPFPLKSKDRVFIKNMVIASCCYMFADSKYDSYDLFGSVNSYFIMINLIQQNQLIADNDIIPIIIKNINNLFKEFDKKMKNKEFENGSRWFNAQTQQKKKLWIKKQKLTSLFYICIIKIAS